MTPAARLSGAIDLLCAIQNAPRRPADATANAFFRERRYIGGGDRRAISTIVWDVLRSWRRLHWHFSDLTGAISPRLLSAASLIFRGESMDQVRLIFSGDRYAPSPLTSREDIALKKLEGRSLSNAKQPRAVRLEYPDWIEPVLAETFGNRLEAEMEALLEAPTLDLRVNLLKGTRDSAIAALRKESLPAEATELSPWGMRLDGRQPVTAAQAFRDGLVEIQDEGSQLVVLAADAKSEHRVLDYCAGAGGKTLALAMTMENRGHIVACDVHEKRLEGAVKRLRRAGVHNVERHLLTSGDKWAKRRAGSFDRVLVDAPCSGTGTWRRNPDARLRLTKTDIEELLVKQAEILDRAASLVKPGGRMIYATCSLLAQENGNQIAAFLKRRSDYRLLSGDEMPSTLPEKLRERGSFALTPKQDGTDGFFACVMERAVEKKDDAT
ncbi:tRNA/rRNA cytosine-C5-methylase Nol1/Nop2/Sun [Neokomagataea thailandica NBRC 106555]|uniref:RsmB/NOP family class I SAM-dependent RNA methyltransferase n=2 Tax=Neokomagataea TaxID=1223423 RepID=A0A4Y6VAV5_9PROT|nr:MULTISPECIES: RsmB/NOP family class I SAM-dependent RNA methyltransferase [Neokomagataea]QDH25597.1 RsmB/NOP family class I SAM-dependent RNA methyltransferase [Neokomagataea tanensis]GBR52588.1 tRNA/rRNA cytosine-C5-methylase Nol1/Nop2/Sun [Neokomagataea thailandica NBRC 106555]